MKTGFGILGDHFLVLAATDNIAALGKIFERLYPVSNSSLWRPLDESVLTLKEKKKIEEIFAENMRQ